MSRVPICFACVGVDAHQPYRAGDLDLDLDGAASELVGWIDEPTPEVSSAVLVEACIGNSTVNIVQRHRVQVRFLMPSLFPPLVVGSVVQEAYCGCLVSHPERGQRMTAGCISCPSEVHDNTSIPCYLCLYPLLAGGVLTEGPAAESGAAADASGEAADASGEAALESGAAAEASPPDT